MEWPTPDESNQPDLWERQSGTLTVGQLTVALQSAPDDAVVVVGLYDGREVTLGDPVDVTMETSDDGTVRVVVTGAKLT